MEVDSGGVPFKFTIDDMARFRRFLILGLENACVYTKTDADIGLEHAAALRRLLESGRGPECVALISQLSAEGRCPKQMPPVFALAMIARFGNPASRRAAYEALPVVCSIPTTFFAFLDFVKSLHAGVSSGWGRVHRAGVAAWYAAQEAPRLAYNLTKYRARKGWRHQDVLRLAHAKAKTPAHAVCLAFASRDRCAPLAAPLAEAVAVAGSPAQKARALLEATDAARGCSNSAELVALIAEHNLVREHVPTTMLGDVAVWRALLARMPMTALMRNVNKMTSVGLFAGDDDVELACQKLTDEDALMRARVHPLNVLVALRTYQKGRGEKGSLEWAPHPAISAALEKAFYLSFKAVEPTGQRLVVAVDVSGSMDSQIAGSCLTSREAVTALAMTYVRTEPECHVVAFSDTLTVLPFNREWTLQQALRYTTNMPFNSTRCSAPMVWARERGLAVDAFVVMTDNETNCDHVPPVVALNDYRRDMTPTAKLVVVATAASEFSVADPNDAGMMDVAGLDSAAPTVIADFLSGKV